MTKTLESVENNMNDLERRIEELERALETDALTGARNRSYFYDKLDLNRFKNGYLYFIDLNNFKRINDEHGHIYGDQVLTKFADEIRKCLGYSDVLIRYAGDEFVIVSEGKLKLESTMEFSQGFVRIKHSWEKKEDLLSEADKKMYRNKMKNKH